MARTGKIARLPLSLREELNERLRDNESGQTILVWLNSLPEVQRILSTQFDGAAISDANLSLWRGGGFSEWMQDQDKVHKVHRLSELSMRLAQASGGNLSEGLLAVAAGKLQEAMEAGVEVEFDNAGEPMVSGISIDKLARAVTAIRDMELKSQKLQLDRVQTEQRAEALTLEKQKFQRETAKLFIAYAVDEEAKRIATCTELGSNDKLEALGKHLFGGAWE